MKILTSFRTSAVRWPAVPLLVLCWYLVGEWVRFSEPHFGTAVGEASAFPVWAIASVCASCAAWEAGRLRRARVWDGTPARHRLQIAGNALLPVGVLAVAAQLTGLMAAALALWAFPDGQGWLAAASAAAVAMAWIVLGFGLGALVPRAVAAPAALICCFAWMTFTASANTTWPRHLTGMQVSASNLTDIVSTEAFVAPIALTGAWALAVILVGSRQQPGKILVTASAGLAVAGTLVAYTIVRDWGPGAPMVARTGTTVCSLESPTVCLPKEYSTLAEPAHTAAGKVFPRLENVGVHAPSRLFMTSRETQVSGETWRFHPSHGTGPEAMEIAVALSAAPAGEVPFCSESYQGTPDVVHAWLLLTAGIGAETVANTTAPEAAAAAARVRLHPAAEQLDWFNSTWTSLKECQTPPALPGSAS